MSLWQWFLSLFWVSPMLQFKIKRRIAERYAAKSEGIIAEATIKAAAVTKAAYNLGTRQAQAELTQKINEGIQIGVERLKKSAISSGRLAGYNEVAEQFGLVPAVTEEAVPHDTSYLPVDLAALHANIYANSYGYTVRIVINGQRIVKLFSTQNKSRRVSLLEAIHYRNSLLPADIAGSATVYDDCMQRAQQEPGSNIADYRTHLRACELYHVAISRVQHDVSCVFLGDDPEDRFRLDDPSIVMRPWTSFFQLRAGLAPAFEDCGLCAKRTLRDLLLFTAAEILNVDGIGPKSLQRMREGLTSHGLALWDDPVPRRSVAVRPGERNQRAIDLG